MASFKDRLDLSKARPTMVWGAWIYDLDGPIPEGAGWPIEECRLLDIVPGKFDPANIPNEIAESAQGYILAIGTGQGFVLFDLR